MQALTFQALQLELKLVARELREWPSGLYAVLWPLLKARQAQLMCQLCYCLDRLCGNSERASADTDCHQCCSCTTRRLLAYLGPCLSQSLF